MDKTGLAKKTITYEPNTKRAPDNSSKRFRLLKVYIGGSVGETNRVYEHVCSLLNLTWFSYRIMLERIRPMRDSNPDIIIVLLDKKVLILQTYRIVFKLRKIIIIRYEITFTANEMFFVNWH